MSRVTPAKPGKFQASLDSAFVRSQPQLLANLDIQEPPTLNLPQPVTLVMLPRGERPAVDCLAFDRDMRR